MQRIVYLLFCLPMLYSCGDKPPGFSTTYIFIDATDSIFHTPQNYYNDIPSILKKMDVDTTKGGFSGGEIKIFIINDLSETRSRSVMLNKGIPGLLGSNELDRADEIKKFSKDLRNSLNELLSSLRFQKEKSKIYQNLCRELNLLKNIESDNKLVIIYSDMLENSDLFSFYGNTSKVNSYISDINKAVSDLSTDCALPELNDIEIHIVTTRTSKTDERINLAEHFWTKLFEAKKAKVEFDSELNF